VAVLPALMTVVLGVHLWLVQWHGMSVPPSLEGKQLKARKFVPGFLLHDAMGWLVALGVLAALAALFPWELGQKADPFAPAPAGIRPEWYFLFMFQTLKFIPAKIGSIDGDVVGVLGFGTIAILWLLVPFLDRRSAKGQNSPVFTAIGVVALIYIIGMTVYGYIA
jgi:quinol-cytochrome oxidoreductase complex cytochrome b subunit